MAGTDPKQAFKADAARLFDQVAADYDRAGGTFFTYFAQQLVERIALAPGERVLDVAAGRGALLFPAAERVGIHGRVIGIDIAPEMVRHTAAEIARRGLPQAEMRVMDAEHLHFPDAMFDAVLCGFALPFFVPHLGATMQAFRRVLRPGGTLATITPTGHDPRWLDLMRLQYSFLPPDFEMPQMWTSVREIDTAEKLTRVFEAAGLVGVEAVTETYTLTFSDPDDWWAWVHSNGTRMVLDAMAPDRRAAFRAAAFDLLHTMRDPDGLLRQQYAALLVTGHAPDRIP